MFGCMLDASKAFDKVRYDKMFKLLLDRGIPVIVVRSLLDIYTRQKVCTKWDGKCSEYFTVINGIRQGGILSPLL